MKTSPVATECIERAILVLRGHKVLLDSDLAELYQVETRSLVNVISQTPTERTGLFAPICYRQSAVGL